MIPGVLARQTHDGLLDVYRKRGTFLATPPGKDGPRALGERAVPAEERLRTDGTAPPLITGQAEAQCRPEQPVIRPPARAAGALAQHAHLVPQGEQTSCRAASARRGRIRNSRSIMTTAYRTARST